MKFSIEQKLSSNIKKGKKEWSCRPTASNLVPTVNAVVKCSVPLLEKGLELIHSLIYSRGCHLLSEG